MKHITSFAIVAMILLTACCKEKPLEESTEATQKATTEKVAAADKKDGGKRTPITEENAKDEPMVGGVQIPNPVRGSSANDIRKKMGLDFNLPKGATDVRYSTIHNLAQIDFKWNDAKCTGRMRPSGETKLQDISGYYYKWDNTDTVSVGYNQAQVSWTHSDGRDLGICIWWDAAPGIMYSVSMDSNASKEKLEELANAFYVQMQGDN